MTRLYHLAQRVFNTPVAIHPQKSEVIIAALAERFGIAQFGRADGSIVVLDEGAASEPLPEHGYENCEGVAVIPISGTLVQKNGYLRPYSGMTGYDGIRQNFLVALDDPSVRAIALDIDSPGGEVAGCFDLVDLIYESRGEKPIHAILNESAYSAAYAIASAADRILVPRTGGVGSIGVVCAHVDMSKALEKEGLKVTLIQYGAHKTDGTQAKPLSDEAHARMQAEIDATGELFVQTVARNRGLSAAAVRDTQAACFMAKEGVDMGLADAVMSPDMAFHSLLHTID